MKNIGIVLIFLLLASTALARIDAPDHATITADQKSITFTVTNTDSTNALPLSITLAGPFVSTISPYPSPLSPGETQTFTATITHLDRETLDNQSYQASILVKLGNQTEISPLRLKFESLNAPLTGNDTGGLAGFFSIFSISLPAIPIEIVNIALAIVLVLILIAVIARVYKRVGTRKQKMEM